MNNSMLSSIKAGEEFGWEEFYQAYLPLMRTRGRDYGLSITETEELVKKTVLSIFSVKENYYYDPNNGRFGDFLRKIIDDIAIGIIRKRLYGNENTIPQEDVFSDERQKYLALRWDVEWKDHVLKESLKVLRNQIEPETYQAFEFYALKGMSANEVSKFLGISEDFVYVSRYRAVSKLKDIIKDTGELYL